MKKIFLSILFAAVLFGCASGPKRVDVTLGSEDYPKERFLTATGIGNSEQEARSNASAELSRIFQSRILGDTMDRVSFAVDQSGAESFRQSIKTELRVISDVELKGVEIPKVWFEKETGTYRAIAVLERARAASEWQSEIDSYDERIDAKLHSIKDVRSGLLRLRELNDVLDIWLIREVSASRLRILGVSERGMGVYDISQALKEASAIKLGMPIYIEVKGSNSEMVSSKLAEALGGAGYVLAPDKSKASVSVTGTSEAEELKSRDKDWNYARARVVLSVLDIAGGIGAGDIEIEDRAAHLNKSEAELKALRAVSDEAAKKLIELLGGD